MKTLSPEAVIIQRMFTIPHKRTQRQIPFILNKAQAFLDEILTQYPKVIIAKARQLGCSSFILARFAVRCMGVQNTRAVVMSHETNATQRLLDRVHSFLENIRGPRPKLGHNSRHELSFPKTQSTFYIGTAGAKAFGRGDWITDLHCSEYAFWEEAFRHHAGIFQAVPTTGRIVIESTGNGRNNDFYYLWQHAEAMGYERVFLPWWLDPDYSLPVTNWAPSKTQHTGYLLELKERHKLTPGQMAWYEAKLVELREDLRLMQQEYPSTPEECFQATGGYIFNVQLSYSPDWQLTYVHGRQAWYLKGHPRQGFNYIFGCDPSGGTGNDDAAIVGFCVQTGEQVFELCNPNINPLECAQLLCELGAKYNQAFLVTEANNHGAAVVAYLKAHYPLSSLYKSKPAHGTTPARYGWTNTRDSKHALIGIMHEELPYVRLYGRQTVTELNAFEETEEGKLMGARDNCVIATGLALLGLKRHEHLRGAHLIVPEPKPKPNYKVITFEDIMSRIKRRAYGGGLY